MGIFSKLFTGSPEKEEQHGTASQRVAAHVEGSEEEEPESEPSEPSSLADSLPSLPATPPSKPAPRPRATNPASSSTQMKAPVKKFVFKPATSPSIGKPRARAETERTVPKQPAIPKPQVAPSAPTSGDTEPLQVPPPPAFNRVTGKSANKPARISVPRPKPSIGAARTAKPLPVRRSPSGSIKVRPPTEGDLGNELDAAFEGAKVADDSVAGPGRMQSTEDTLAELRRLFGEIASHHTAQIRDFIVELSRGPTSKQWAEICAPSVDSIRRAADGMGHPDLSAKLRRFDKALDDTRRGAASAMITGEPRTHLLEAYAGLTKILPEAFDVERHRGRRDPIIIHTLLEQVVGLSTLARDRIYAAGLSTLDAFFSARPDELAAAAGVSRAQAERIVERFAAYRASRAERAEHAEHAAEREHLADLVERLRRRQQEFREAELAENIRDKRRLRDERAELIRDIDLALAHLGQIDLIEAIKRAPVDTKIERVGCYLKQPAGT